MNLYITILLEFLLISSSILILFKFRTKLGLAPLYILLGTVQFLQANLGSSFSFNFFGDYVIYPGSIILFSGVLFAVLLIYIKEGVASARALIVGIILSNIIMTLMFEITYLQHILDSQINNTAIDPNSVFNINVKYFLSGTALLILDFILLVILYQYLISKIKKLPFFLILFISLFSILIFDAITFNFVLFYGTPLFKTSLISHLVGKSVSALVFSTILYLYVKYFDIETASTTFIANQNRDIFSIIKYEKKYYNLKAEKELTEQKLGSQLEITLNNISDGFVSLDTNWCYTYINKKAADFLGKLPENLIGKHIWTEFPDGIGLPFYKAYHKAVETQKTIYFEDYYEPFDKWFENRIYPSPEGLTIYFTDITEKKKADINNQMLLSLIETSDDFVGLATLEGKPIYLNANGKKLVELEGDEKMPDSISDFFPEHYQDVIENEHMPSIYKNSKWKGEAEFKNFITGGTIPIEMSGFLIKDSITNKPMALGVVATDITERKKAKEQIIESEKYLDNIINNIGDPLFVKDEQSCLVLVNDAFCSFFNLSKADIIGKTLVEKIPPEEMEVFFTIDKQVLSTGVENVNEETLTVNEKETRILSTKKTRFVDSSDNKFLIGVIRDITEQKEAEFEIQKLATIVRRSEEFIGIASLDAKVIYINEGGIKLAGINKDVSTTTMFDYFDEQGLEKFKTEVIPELHKKGRWVGEMFLRNFKTSELVPVWMDVFHIYNPNSQEPMAYATITSDDRERKKAERALKENEEKFSKAFESNVIGKAILNKEKKIIEINDALTNIVGFKRENMLGKTAEEIGLFNFESQKNLENENKLWSQFSEKGYASNIELQYLMQSGKELFILISVQALQLNNEDHILITVLDITEKKNVEAELENHRNNLEELVELRTTELEKEKVKAQSADLMKSAFLATMSHELRTPMNSIIGFTGILLKEFAGPLNEEQKKQLSMVKTSGQHLLGLINDILDISKIEAGKLKVFLYPFNYLTTLEKTIDFLMPQASKKGLIINSEISEMNIILNSDERRVEQVLLNLLSNAIKFSNNGSIEVKVSVVDNLLVTQVIDQGIGISKKDLNKLFMPFIQIEGGLSRSHEGSGLGLAICKNLIEKLGGTIQVKSKKREGSNFTFKLPLEHFDSK